MHAVSKGEKAPASNILHRFLVSQHGASSLQAIRARTKAIWGKEAFSLQPCITNVHTKPYGISHMCT